MSLQNAQVQNSEQTCAELLGARYHRLNPVLERDIPGDSPSVIPELTKARAPPLPFFLCIMCFFSSFMSGALLFTPMCTPAQVALAMDLRETADWIRNTVYEADSFVPIETSLGPTGPGGGGMRRSDSSDLAKYVTCVSFLSLLSFLPLFLF